jgi:hypothetical protein
MWLVGPQASLTLFSVGPRRLVRLLKKHLMGLLLYQFHYALAWPE